MFVKGTYPASQAKCTLAVSAYPTKATMSIKTCSDALIDFRLVCDFRTTILHEKFLHAKHEDG